MTRFERWALGISLSLFLVSVAIYGMATPNPILSALH